MHETEERRSVVATPFVLKILAIRVFITTNRVNCRNLKTTWAIAPLFWLCSLSANAQSVIPGYEITRIKTLLNGPITFALAEPGTVLFGEKNGAIRVIRDRKLLDEPFIDLSELTNTSGDRGLVSITVHPDYPETPYVYASTSTDALTLLEVLTGKLTRANKKNADNADPKPGVVLRFTADEKSDYSRALAGSTKVVLGAGGLTGKMTTPSCNDFGSKQDSTKPVVDCIPNDHEKHTIGSLRFGTDDMLYVGVGDGARAEFADHLSARSINVNSLAGKVLRIDPETGDGLKDNPFFDGDPKSNASRILSKGLRNPFRIAVHEKTGAVWSGDVGGWDWEEINPGNTVDGGWPCFEGGRIKARYTDLFFEDKWCKPYESKKTTLPYYAYHHNNNPAAIILGEFAPEGFGKFGNHLFFGDFVDGRIRAMAVDSGKSRAHDEDVFEFASDYQGLVEMRFSPEGELYVLTLLTGSLDVIRPVKK